MNQPRTPKLRDLQILHLSLTIGILAIGALFYFFFLEEPHMSFSSLTIKEYTALAITIAALLFSQYLNKSRLNFIREIESTEEKWKNYYAHQIVRYALIEGPALICAVLGFMTQNLMLFILAALLAGVLYVMRPFKEKVFLEADFDMRQQSEFNTMETS